MTQLTEEEYDDNEREEDPMSKYVPIECPHCGYQGHMFRHLYEKGENFDCDRCDKGIIVNGRMVDFSDSVNEEGG